MNEQWFTPEEVEALRKLRNRVEKIKKSECCDLTIDLSEYTLCRGERRSLLKAIELAHKDLDQFSFGA
jgi:hypothetical protein